jgi:hypothetical protein
LYLSRFGYEDGKGLGKSSSGIVAPIVLAPVGDGAGVVVQLKEKKNPSQNITSTTDTSRIVLLKNMVTKKELEQDEESLRSELMDECKNFGKVQNIVFHAVCYYYYYYYYCVIIIIVVVLLLLLLLLLF